MAVGGLARESSINSSWDIVSVYYAVRRPGATQSSVCRSVIVQVLDEVDEVAVRLVVILGGHSPNFFHNTGYVEIIVERSVTDAPGALTVVLRSFVRNR